MTCYQNPGIVLSGVVRRVIRFNTLAANRQYLAAFGGGKGR